MNEQALHVFVSFGLYGLGWLLFLRAISGRR